MGFLFALLSIAVYVFYMALILRLVFDWVQSFARFWRPKGAVLVIASAVYGVTDPPMDALRKVIPPVRLGAVSLDVGFLILVFAVSILSGVMQQLTLQFS